MTFILRTFCLHRSRRGEMVITRLGREKDLCDTGEEEEIEAEMCRK